MTGATNTAYKHMDFGSIIPKVALTALFAKYLRDYLETSVNLPEWDKYLKSSWIAALLLLLSSQLLSFPFISKAYFGLLILTLIAFLYQIREQRQVRTLLIALYPACVAYLADGFFRLFPQFHDENNGLFSTAVAISNAWLFGFGIYAYRQNKREQKERKKEEAERKLIEARKNELEFQVAERTMELTNQKEALEMTLAELKATQEQLVHNEKMASLGELTAGIAHEIQNPLNFVNNFAELSIELAQELREELEKPDLDKELILDLVSDLVQNQEKINHHGKRAANIVTGMLQHARTSTGAKEPTDLNNLAEEYLRLSYHGLRAKDSGFNARMTTELDPAIGKIDLVPQDMGRVLLNLINNAFYAVSEKRKQLAGMDTAYEPTVSVITRRTPAAVVIRIQDNGTGIPESLRAKIFQPFFTTKPTGQGTGLGLSLSFDIITKGHGGTMEIETAEGEGTTFILTLPLTASGTLPKLQTSH